MICITCKLDKSSLEFRISYTECKDCVKTRDFKNHTKSNPKSNPTRTPEYFEALDWVKENYPGRRVGFWAYPLWEAAHPGKKWADLRTTQEAIEVGEEEIDFPLRKQSARTFGDADAPSTERIVVPGPVAVKHEHFDMQKAIEERVTGSLAEKNTIDSLFEQMSGEIKPYPTSGAFDQAIGKLIRERASEAAKELAFITDMKPKTNGLALKALGLIGATWIYQTPERMTIYNDQFAGPSTRKFVDRYNGIQA